MNAGITELRELSRDTGIEYDGNDNGILYLFRSEESFEERAEDWTILEDHGLRLEQADVARCIEVEPTLEPVAEKIGGGFYSPDEGAGGCIHLHPRSGRALRVIRGEIWNTRPACGD